MANDWLVRLRILAQAPQVRPITSNQTVWRLTYLHDDESEFDPDPTLATKRMVAGSVANISAVGFGSEFWEGLSQLPWGYTPRAIDTLMLDAFTAMELDDVGAAAVLGAVALETHIVRSLDLLASLYGVPPQVWSWINDRGDHQKEPAVADRYDPLLKAITGRTLKEDLRLWEGFKNLRDARNRFVHSGVATIGGQPIDRQRVASLLAIASEIVDWVDALLPEAYRKPRLSQPGQGQMTMSFIIAAPDATTPPTIPDTEQ